jgi:hypothetical protein
MVHGPSDNYPNASVGAPTANESEQIAPCTHQYISMRRLQSVKTL